jgi:hypothetical protein
MTKVPFYIIKTKLKCDSTYRFFISSDDLIERYYKNSERVLELPDGLGWLYNKINYSCRGKDNLEALKHEILLAVKKHKGKLDSLEEAINKSQSPNPTSPIE